MSGLKLRDYQTECLQEIDRRWEAEQTAGIIALPTGAGKTVIMAKVPELPAAAARGRTLAVAGRDELIRQTAAKMRAANPGLRVGVVQAGTDEVGADIVVASVPTLARAARRERIRNVGTLLVDEAHHAAAPTWRDVIEHYGDARRLGFTATPERSDGKALAELWPDGVIFTRTLGWMVNQGYLVKPEGLLVEVEDLDLAKVKRNRGGDYADGALGAAMSASLAPSRIVEAWSEHADNESTILFAPTVEFARIMCDTFAAEGVKADVVWGEMAIEDRREVLRRFEAGEITVLCNCMVLTEGTDLPIASVAIVARPTTHHGLWVQMVGRVLRLYPGKVRALVLDVTGASRRHSLQSVVDLMGDAKEETEEDETQVTLDDELEPEEGAADVQYRDGVLVAKDVDLFHGSQAAWSKTYRGVWYLVAGQPRQGPFDPELGRYLVLHPTGQGTWHIAEVAKAPGGVLKRTQLNPTIRGSAWVELDVPDIGYAMAIAEADVTWREQALASKGESWRSKPVTVAQRKTALRYGLIFPEKCRAGVAAEIIGRHFASWRIDGVGEATLT